MGFLGPTTQIILVPVKVVTSSGPIGPILAIILIIIYWTAILNILAFAILIGLLIGVNSWYKQLSEDYSLKAKIIGHTIIFLLLGYGYASVYQEINKNDLSQKTTEALESERLPAATNSVQEKLDNDSYSEKYENEGSKANEHPEINPEVEENIALGLDEENISSINSQIKSAATKELHYDGEHYFYEFRDTLYEVKNIKKSKYGIIQSITFYYMDGRGIIEKTIFYNDNGTKVEKINDEIIRHGKITSDPRFYISIVTILFFISLLIYSIFKKGGKKEKSTKKEKLTNIQVSEARNESINPSDEKDDLQKSFATSNAIRAKVVQELGLYNIIFEPSISLIQTEQLREFIQKKRLSNSKKIKINGQGQNVRGLDLLELRMTIDFLESLSIFTRNKSKFYNK